LEAAEAAVAPEAAEAARAAAADGDKYQYQLIRWGGKITDLPHPL
jgi:hypothetical protein